MGYGTNPGSSDAKNQASGVRGGPDEQDNDFVGGSPLLFHRLQPSDHVHALQDAQLSPWKQSVRPKSARLQQQISVRKWKAECFIGRNAVLHWPKRCASLRRTRY